MKILIIRCSPDYMEVRNASYNVQEVGLASALVKKGHKCDIVFWTDKEECEVKIPVEGFEPITLYYRHSISILKNGIYTGIDDLISQYDIIQPSEHNQLGTWMLSKKYPNKTVIYHGPYYSAFNKKYNLMCKVFDKIVLPAYKKNDTKFITKSELAKDFLVSKGIKDKNICVAGVGINTNTFAQLEDSDIPKELFEIKNIDADIKLLYIGKLEPRRSIPFLFDILKEIKEKGINPKLVIVGNGDEEYINSCFEHAKNINVYENIYWIKRVQQKYLQFAYKNTDVFLLPTNYEIFGMVLLEAMYFGTPAITTKNGGSQMLIENGKNGMIIDDFDAKKWADAVMKIKNNKNITIASHEKISNSYTWDALVEKFINEYEKKLIK